MSQATYERTADVPLGDLRPFPGNARRGDPAVILQSLVRTGQFRSLIVRDTGTGLVVLAGNHTLQALLAHGPGPCGLTTTVDGEELPCALCSGQEWAPVARCEIVTCDDATATRINLVDNKAAQTGGWDEEALADLIAGLDGDLAGTGYTDQDLADLVAAIEEAYEEEDEEPEQPAEATLAGTTTPAQPATSSAPPASGDTIPEGPAPGTVAPPMPDGTRSMLLTYPAADRDEAARLVVAAREVFPAEDAAVIVLRALRTLVAVLDSRHAHDGVVTVQALLRAAGPPSHEHRRGRRPARAAPPAPP